MKRQATIDTDVIVIGGALEKSAIEQTEAIKKRMSPPGALGLPPLLDARRLEFGLVDEVFEQQPVYDRIFVFQVPPAWARGDTFGDSSIVMPDLVKERKLRTAPIGIITGAGLKALDELRSHGIDLGHIVTFVRLSPWSMPIAMVNHKEVELRMLFSGDIISSFDLAEKLRNKECEYILDDETKQHLYKDETGRVWLPKVALREED